MSRAPRHLIRRFAGLYGSANPYAGAPEGAMDIGDDCVIRSDGTLEPRRGYSHVISTSPINAIGWKEGKLLALGWDDPVRGITGQLRSYDFGMGLFTPLPMNPGNQPFDRPGGVIGQHTRFVAANKAIYFQSRYGLTKVEALSNGVCRIALQPAPRMQDGPISEESFVNGPGNAILNGQAVVYRITRCRFGANKEFIESEPSNRKFVSNTTGSTQQILVNFFDLPLCPPDSFSRIYRSKGVPNATEPSDEMFLIAETVWSKGSPVLDGNGFIALSGGDFGSIGQDNTPDTSLFLPLYTNPISGATLDAAASPAPLAADMAYFKDRMLYLNTLDVQRLVLRMIGTGPGGIDDGSTITVDGLTLTFTTNSGLPNSGNNLTFVATGGTIAQNLADTARELVEKINKKSKATYVSNLQVPLLLYARYISQGAADAGQILIQRVVPGATAFTVSTSSRAGWSTDHTIGTTSDPNEQKAGLSWSAQDEPEAVPLLNSARVGDADSAGQRIIALKESALIFKKDDGLWRWTDDGVSIALQIADPTIRLIAPETAQPISNYVLALCDSGVLLITENGQTVNISRDRVEQELLELISYVGRDTMAKVAFAVPYELEHQYILCLPETPTATSCTIQYVYHLPTQTWQRWRLPGVIAGSVNPTTGQIVWAMGSAPLAPNVANNLWVERKNFDSTDYKDASFTISCPTSSAVATMTFSGDLRAGANAIAVGDIVQQAQATFFVRQRVTAVSYSASANQTTITLDAAPANAWSTGIALTVLKAVPSRLRFLPFHASAPLSAKEWGDPHIAFRFCDLDFASYAWTSEIYTSLAPAQERIFGAPSSPEPKPPIIGSGWGADPWGSFAWSRQTRDVVLKTTLPADVGECAMLTLAMTLANAEARWELSLIGLGISGSPGEVVR